MLAPEASHSLPVMVEAGGGRQLSAIPVQEADRDQRVLTETPKTLLLLLILLEALALVGFLSGGRSFDFKTPAHRSRAGPSVRVQEVSLSVTSSVFCPNTANVFLAAGENNSAGGVYLPSVPLLTACHAPEVVVVVAVVVAAAVRAGTLATVFVGGEFLVFQLCAVLGGEFIVAHKPEDT